MNLRERILAVDRELAKRRSSPQERTMELVRELDRSPGLDREVLILWIQGTDSVLSSVALEYLAQDSSEDAEILLAGLVNRSDQTEDWFPAVLLTTLRKRLDSAAEVACEYVSRILREPDLPLALVTHLPRVAPKEGVRLGAEYLADRVPAASTDGLKSLSQAFSNGYLFGDGALLADLVRHVLQQNEVAGRRFGNAVLDSLGKPWIARKLGREATSTLASRIQSVLTSTL